LVIAQGLMDEAQLESVLSPERLSGLTLGTVAITLPEGSAPDKTG
jgi:hypothetical protein